MATLKQICEPIAIWSLLLFGVWLNRRKHSSDTPPPTPLTRPFFGRSIRVPDTSRFASKPQSQFLARFPFLVEIGYWLALYNVYQRSRGLLAGLRPQEATTVLAQQHGLSVLRFEGKLRMDWEETIQSTLIRHTPRLLNAICAFYSWCHLPVTIAFIVWLYWSQPRTIFNRIRRGWALTTLYSFVIFTAWPCMPPRLLPDDTGYHFVDSVHNAKQRPAWANDRWSNILAAMPSMHAGWALIVGVGIYKHSRHFQGRYNALALLYPATMFLAVVATANHYISDVVVGYTVCALAYATNHVVLNLLPLEHYILRVLHAHKTDLPDDYCPADESRPTYLPMTQVQT